MSDYIIKTDENKIVKVRDIQLVLLEMAKDILDLLERHLYFLLARKEAVP